MRASAQRVSALKKMRAVKCLSTVRMRTVYCDGLYTSKEKTPLELSRSRMHATARENEYAAMKAEKQQLAEAQLGTAVFFFSSSQSAVLSDNSALRDQGCEMIMFFLCEVRIL